MEQVEYIPGQRWISNTESELGLGLVVEISGRMITISFPAAAERRTYAVDNAPLSRVVYEIDDQISNHEGITIAVTERCENAGLYTYLGTDVDGNSHQFDELELNSFVQFNKPQDRLFAGQVDKISSFQLRLESWRHLRHHQQSPAYGLLGPRVQLLPHQFYIARQVAGRYAPRVLLADEVGLGKTIEAGLILHQQLISRMASRVLIVVPDSLVHQWLVEMLRRFNLHFSIIDSDRCNTVDDVNHDNQSDISSEIEQLDVNVDDIGSDNPFESAQLILCSLSFLQQNPEQHQQALNAEWDLMVVDEAHHLVWHEHEVSPAYRCIESLAHQIPGLLLLTATPEQLGVDSHFARLRLLDPDRYYDLEAFRQEQAGYIQINDLIEELMQFEDLSNLESATDLLSRLEGYLGQGPVKELLASEDRQDAINHGIDSLLDRHGTGRVLFRNTREAVQGFPDRQLYQYPLAPPTDFSPGNDLNTCLHPELLLGRNWLDSDPRVEWLSSWLSQCRDEKVLLICAMAETAIALENFLRQRHGIRTALFHEGMTLIARDRAAAYFGEMDDESAQILICSEIGSEGRNFQFAHHLILYDLPLNPDLLEQRIGRLDRIGQTQTVQVHVPYYEQSPQAGLLLWYHEGINAFERVCPVGPTLFQQHGEKLQEVLLGGDSTEDQQALEDLILSSHKLSQEILEELEKGRNRLLELSSCHPREAADIVSSVSHSSSALELAAYMERLFDLFGVDHQTHSAESVILHPGDHMVCHQFPGLTEDGITATYQRAQALIREDMHFLTWEHPMVSGAMDMLLSGEFGNTAFCTVKNSALKSGTLMLEAIFTLHVLAPGKVQLHRYLPATMIRVVVDSLNRDLTRALTEEKLNKMATKVPLRSVHEMVKHARPQILELIGAAEKLADGQRQLRIDQAQQEMQQVLEYEIERLEVLATVNANIRSEEIDFLKASYKDLQALLDVASLKLDAIRVVLAT